jgi:hypothetical protein
MDILLFYKDYQIQYITEGKNVGEGWVNITCPFCDDPSEHLGYNLEKDYYRCWRCGWHTITETFAKLLNVGKEQTYSILKQYGAQHEPYVQLPTKVGIKPFQFPFGTGPLQQAHKQYLEKRDFDPNKLALEWGLMATGPVGGLDGDDYKWRIIAPIYWEGGIVSFQSRAISAKAILRYKACPKPREIIHHKEILYGKDWKDVGICVEGVTDVWRLGSHAFAVFGTGYTNIQIQRMASLFKTVIILFDNEPEAQRQALRLEKELRFRNVKTRIEITDAPDPAKMKQEDADYFVKHLIK